MDMRALYYVALTCFERESNKNGENEMVKANENCLNQNFSIIAQRIREIEARLAEIQT